MFNRLNARFILSIAAALAALAGASQSIAANPPDWSFDLPAGSACAGFDLHVEGWDNPQRVFKTFYDKNGNVVRMLSAGKGSDLTFTNLSTGSTLSLKSNGAVDKTTWPGGIETHVSTGHIVLILFPSDVPAGPSTTLYVGRIVYTIDQSGVWTLQSTSGKKSDICAALSG
jgi:hypothetical protein